jgi:hydrogenase nickel incorporation protein HypB
MCTVCGCGEGEVRIDPDRRFAGARFEPLIGGVAAGRGVVQAHGHHDPAHVHADGSVHRHAHGPVAGLGSATPGLFDADLQLVPATASGLSAPGVPESRLVRIEADLLAKNDAVARGNRAHFAGHRLLALNLVSSPGSGKTTLLVRTLEALRGRQSTAVIEGDQQTSNDAERIRATGVPAVQVNTGKGCHLDAAMVSRAFDRLPALDGGVLFIENVGNLVCPAGFDLGEAHKVVLASVTEGEDKPLKYPDIFAASSLMLVSKVDLLPHLDFDVDALVANARRVRPGIAVIRVSARTGEGMDAWLQWIDAARTVQGLSA